MSDIFSTNWLCSDQGMKEYKIAKGNTGCYIHCKLMNLRFVETWGAGSRSESCLFQPISFLTD